VPPSKAILTQAEAEQVVAQRFHVGNYIVHDFIPKPGAAAPAPIVPPRTLKVSLYWVKNDELTPWFVGQEKGFFARAGIKLDITEGGPGRDMLSSLIANRLDMYIGPADNALFLITSRTGTDVKMICALMKDSPSGLIGLDATIPHDQASTRHIGRADLVGHRIGLVPGAEYLSTILCAEMNIPQEDVQTMKSGATPDALIGGAIDYYGGFRTNQTRVLERQGYKNWTFFPFAEVGISDYFDVSIVTADFYRKEPQILANYVYALNEAIAYEIAHPEEAADIAVRNSPDYPVTKAEALWRIKQEIPFYLGDGSEPVLAMKESVVQHELAEFYRYGQIELPPADAGH
jgi:ABC-type nitrate/sulfonate/bicarbonate transport system substrate-binding protein